jgi:hypothetical protein
LFGTNSLCVFWFSKEEVCQLGTARFLGDAHYYSVQSGISSTCLLDTSWRPCDSLHGKPLFQYARERVRIENNRAGLGVTESVSPKLFRLLTFLAVLSTFQSFQFSSNCDDHFGSLAQVYVSVEYLLQECVFLHLFIYSYYCIAFTKLSKFTERLSRKVIKFHANFTLFSLQRPY